MWSLGGAHPLGSVGTSAGWTGQLRSAPGRAGGQAGGEVDGGLEAQACCFAWGIQPSRAFRPSFRPKKARCALPICNCQCPLQPRRKVSATSCPRLGGRHAASCPLLPTQLEAAGRRGPSPGEAQHRGIVGINKQAPEPGGQRPAHGSARLDASAAMGRDGRAVSGPSRLHSSGTMLA